MFQIHAADIQTTSWSTYNLKYQEIMWCSDDWVWYYMVAFLYDDGLTHCSLRDQHHFNKTIFNLDLLIGIFRFPYDKALGWMKWDFTDDKSTLA